MKLKRLPDNGYSDSRCAASRCRRKAAVVLYAPGHLPLCEEHWDVRIAFEVDLASRRCPVPRLRPRKPRARKSRWTQLDFWV